MAEALEQMILPAVNRHLVDTGERAEQVISQLMVSMLYDRPEVASAVERERELPGAAAPRAPRRGRGRRRRGAAGRRERSRSPPPRPAASPPPPADGWGTPSSHAGGWGRASPDAGAALPPLPTADDDGDDDDEAAGEPAAAPPPPSASRLVHATSTFLARWPAEVPRACAPKAACDVFPLLAMVPAKARPGVTAALEARAAEDPYGALVDVKLAAGRPPRLQFGGANPAVVTVGGAPLLTAEDLARACAPLTSTALRDAAALVGAYRERHAPVGDCWVVDQSLELGGDGLAAPRASGGGAVPCQGEALHEAMLRVLRNHTPAAIVVDELVDRAAALAAADVGKRGVQLLASAAAWEKGATSAHARSLAELVDDAALAPVLGDFETVTLSDREAARRAKTQRDPRKRRAASLAAARKEREAEDLDQRFREAALASGVKISPREKILLEELDCRTWLDQALTTVWATYHAKISGWLEGVLAGVLDGLVPLGPIDSFTFKTFQLGAAAPRVRRVVPVRLAEDGVVMLDLDLDWRGSGVDVDLSARLGGGWIGASVPLGLDHVSFKATLRVRCVLGDRSPFAALVDVAFARKPEVLDFGLSVISGDITGLPSIPALVSNALEGVIDGLMSDPFVVVEVGGADAGGGFEARETLRTATKSKTLNPTWDGEVFTLTIADPAVDRVRISVFDYDLGGEPDPLGSAWLGGRLLRDLARGSTRAFWLRLEPPSKGAGKLRYGGAGPRVRLERGAILKEGFGGFKRWSHRWLELELELDLTADGFRLAAVPEINQLAAALRYGKPASTDDAEAARGEVRLSPDAAVSILEEKKKQAVVEWFESHEFCGGVALGESRGEYADFSAGRGAPHRRLRRGPHGASEHLGAATFRCATSTTPSARGLGAARGAGSAGAAGDVRSTPRVRRALDRPKQMAGGVGTAATVLRAANIFRSKANTPDRVSCLSAMGASARREEKRRRRGRAPGASTHQQERKDGVHR
ncbi:C2 domain-containing protein [Aureococcus anophagefferens]|nr:C2 domain-containing protein [Aureococcus anophagefferens]